MHLLFTPHSAWGIELLKDVSVAEKFQTVSVAIQHKLFWIVVVIVAKAAGSQIFSRV